MSQACLGTVVQHVGNCMDLGKKDLMCMGLAYVRKMEMVAFQHEAYLEVIGVTARTLSPLAGGWSLIVSEP